MSFRKPTACSTCLSAGQPCIVWLAFFHGCLLCKFRCQRCSLSPQVGKKKALSDKALCWWLTVIHHIRALLALQTPQGAIEVLPDYSGVTATGVPTDKLDSFRQRMSQPEINKQCKLLTATADSIWPHFYGMPYAYLIELDMNNKRPLAPLWPKLPKMSKVIVVAKRIYTDGKNGLLPRLWAAQFHDGYNISKRSYIRYKNGKADDPFEDKRKVKKGKKSSSLAPSETESDESQC